MGGANWLLRTALEKVVLLSDIGSTSLAHASMSRHYHAQELDTDSIKNADVLVVAQSSFQSAGVRSADYSAQLRQFCEALFRITQILGGHVVVPCRPSPMLLDLFGIISLFFGTNPEMAPGKGHMPTIIFLSPQAKALCATADIDAEWLPSDRQERAYKPEEPFFSNDMIAHGKLKLFDSIHDDQFRLSFANALAATAIGTTVSTNPLILFVEESNMQQGEVVHLINFFKQDPRCGILAIEPVQSRFIPDLLRLFKRDDAKIQFAEVILDPRVDVAGLGTLLHDLTPRWLVAPNSVVQSISQRFPTAQDPSQLLCANRIAYSEGDQLTIKLVRAFERAEMDHELAEFVELRTIGGLPSQTNPQASVVGSISTKVTKRDGKIKLSPASPTSPNASLSAQRTPKHLWGNITAEAILCSLQNKFSSNDVRLASPSIAEILTEGGNVVATIEVNGTGTHVKCDDAPTRRLIISAIATLSL